jgi:hypothetical protein
MMVDTSSCRAPAHCAGGAVGQCALVGAGRAAPLQQPQPIDRLQQGRRGVAEFGIVNQDARCGITHDEAQFRHGQAPVQRYEDRTEPAAGELQFEEVGAVLRQDGCPIALAHTL